MSIDQPHRSYIRFETPGFARLGFSLAIVIACEIVVWLLAIPASSSFSRLVCTVLPAGNTAPHIETVPLGPLQVFPVVFREQPLDFEQNVMWLLGAAIVFILMIESHRFPARLRPPMPFLLLGVYNIMILIGSSLYILLWSQLGLDLEDFSMLYLETEVFIWFMLPVIIWMLCLHFSPRAQFFLTIIVLIYEYTFAMFRYALFLWLIGRLGSVVMPNLYLCFGPLLDFGLCIGIFTIFLPKLVKARRRPLPMRWA